MFITAVHNKFDLEFQSKNRIMISVIYFISSKVCTVQ